MCVLVPVRILSTSLCTVVISWCKCWYQGCADAYVGVCLSVISVTIIQNTVIISSMIGHSDTIINITMNIILQQCVIQTSKRVLFNHHSLSLSHHPSYDKILLFVLDTSGKKPFGFSNSCFFRLEENVILSSCRLDTCKTLL